MRAGWTIAAIVLGLVGMVVGAAACSRSGPSHTMSARSASGPDAKAPDSPGEAAEFFDIQRRPIDGTEVDMGHLFEVLGDIRERQRELAIERSGAGPGDVISWSGLGPGNLGGRTRTLVFDPTDPDIMYTAGVTGGVWKSIDAGASWTPLDDVMANLSVTTIVMDPTNPAVLYAGTGEGFFPSTTYVGRGFGIFKTTDAGATWTQLPNTANAFFYHVNRLAISPNDPTRIYAGTRTGVWRSTDAGATWEIVLANPDRITVGPTVPVTLGCNVGCTDLVIRNDRDPDVLFAAFGSFERDGLYRTDNGGDAWIQYTTGASQGRMELALAPSNNDVMYLCMASNGNGLQVGRLVQLFRTVDGGQSFTAQADFANDPIAPELLSNMFVAFGCVVYTPYSQGWYDNAVAVDPTDPDTVWVGGIDVTRSVDGGVTWDRPAYYRLPPGHPSYVHADIHGIFFHPDYDGASNQTVFISCDGGLYRTANATAAGTQTLCPDIDLGPNPDVTWQTLNHGYAVTQFYHGDTSPVVDRFVGGAQDNGTSAGNTTGAGDPWTPIYGGDGGYVAIDPTDPDTIYVEIQYFPTMARSTDGGQTFAPAISGITDTDGLFITPFAMDQNNPQILWTGGSRPWRTTNGANSWQVARASAFPASGKISAIGIAPSDSNTVYLGLTNGRVFRTSSALAPIPIWIESNNAHGLINGAYVSSINVHPTDPARAYLTYSTYGVPHVYTTANSGASWSPRNGAGAQSLPDIPAHWIAIRPSNPDQLYVATELGVFASDDAGVTWDPTGLGMPNVVVESLDFQSDDALVAFTYGRGAWRASLAPTPVPCVGDVNGDGFTNAADFTILAGNFGASVPPSTGGDLNGDGLVNSADFVILAGDFGCGN